jgi:hypothetical protein
VTSDVTSAVKELARDGITRFRPSFVASRTATAIEQVHADLAALASEGLLTPHFELICPNPGCHRTVATYTDQRDIPVGSKVSCSSCDEDFVVALENVWVYYSPSQALLLRVNQERAASEKKNRSRRRREGL